MVSSKLSEKYWLNCKIKFKRLRNSTMTVKLSRLNKDFNKKKWTQDVRPVILFRMIMPDSLVFNHVWYVEIMNLKMWQ